LSAELTKTHSFRLFFGDFAHWEHCSTFLMLIIFMAIMFMAQDVWIKLFQGRTSFFILYTI